MRRNRYGHYVPSMSRSSSSSRRRRRRMASGMNIVPSALNIVPSAALDANTMTVLGVVSGAVVGAGLMHLAHRRGWFGMGESSDSSSSSSTTPNTSSSTSTDSRGLRYPR